VSLLVFSESLLSVGGSGSHTHTHTHTEREMAESDWDTVTVLRKKNPSASQSKSRQVSVFRIDDPDHSSGSAGQHVARAGIWNIPSTHNNSRQSHVSFYMLCSCCLDE